MNIQQKVARLLIKNHITISVAESCTGGLIASKLTDIPGISEVFDTGMVTYSNRAKMDYLGVGEGILKAYGPVSRETAVAMAEGIRQKANTDLGVSVTGIAGPSGGTPEKPVGLVYIALAAEGFVKCEEFRFEGNRRDIRNSAVLQAFEMILNFVSNK